MRTPISIIMSVACMLGAVALADDEEPVRRISVSGTAETRIAPDQIVWRIGLRDTDPDLLAAKARNDEKMRAVVALREKLGVEEGDFWTGHVSVNREYEHDQQGNRGEFKYFVVNRSATIRQRDLKRFDEFFDALLSSAEMEVDFSSESSRIYEVRAETRIKALQAARDKAAALAEVVGAKLGRALTIDEHPEGSERSRPWANEWSNSEFVVSEPPADVATERYVPGSLTVQMTVYAVFELE